MGFSYWRSRVGEMIDNITNPQKPKKLYYRSERLQIIPTTLFNRVRDKVKFQRSLRNQINKTKHTVLLRGKLFCESCGEIYGCRVKHKKYEYYYYCWSKENNWRKASEKKVKCDIKKGMNIHNIYSHLLPSDLEKTMGKIGG